jgi:hypothetical protein
VLAVNGVMSVVVNNVITIPLVTDPETIGLMSLLSITIVFPDVNAELGIIKFGFIVIALVVKAL